MSKKISVSNMNVHLDNYGYKGDLEVGIGGQLDVASFNVKKNTAFHQQGPILSSCKAFKEHGKFVIRDYDALSLCSELTAVPPPKPNKYET